MAANYTIVQYVPNPTADERINVGVIVFGEGIVQSHFVENWQRIRQFGGKDIRHLRDFSEYAGRLDEVSIMRMTQRWMNSIQFTKPIWAELSHDNLVFEAAKEFLVDPPLPQRAHRSRNDVVKQTSTLLRRAVRRRAGGTGTLLVKNRRPVSGSHGDHNFDIFIGQDRPLIVAQGLSFEIPSEKAERDSDAVAWTVKDTKDLWVDGGLTVAVIVAPPYAATSLYRQAQKTLESLGAEWIVEREVQKWVENVASRV